jgi:hypothetical protein
MAKGNSMKKYLATTTFLLFFYVLVFAQERKPDFVATPEGDLSLVIVAAKNPEFLKKWFEASVKTGPTLPRERKLNTNETMTYAFIVSGLSANEDRNYSYSISFYVVDPTGKPIGGIRDFAGGTGLLPNKPVLFMADPAFDLTLEAHDPIGKYILVAQVDDKLNGKIAKSNYVIEFIK